MHIPSGYNIDIRQGDDPRIAKLFVYPDSSFLYITDDDYSGWSHRGKVDTFGPGVYVMVLANDTLDISGKYQGLYWREIKQNEIVFGYVNVKPENKQEYDDALSTLTRRK